MKTLSQFIAEASSEEISNKSAKERYDDLRSSAGTVGAHKGNVRVYYDHTGGQLKRSLVGDYNNRSYGKYKGHNFAMHYSARPGHNVYVHANLPLKTDLSDTKKVEDEITKQNPHTKGTGHAAVLAHDIAKYHGKK